MIKLPFGWQFDLPLERRYTIAPAVLLVIALTLALLEPHSSTYLIYDRDKVHDGEYWRLLTGNFVHTNLNHVLLNCAGIFFIWLVQAEQFSKSQYFTLLLTGSLFSGLGIHVFGDYSSYAGLSGTLHGVIVYGAVKDIKQGQPFGAALLFGVIIKVAYENLIGPNVELEQTINAKVAVDAHLYGMVAGLFMALPVFYRLLTEGKDQPIQK